MKPTQKQIELIKAIKNIANSWASTNDINSPTHHSDIGELLQPFIIEAEEAEHILLLSEIEAKLDCILLAIKRLERENLYLKSTSQIG